MAKHTFSDRLAYAAAAYALLTLVEFSLLHITKSISLAY